jgi:hypothetical protein
VWNRFHGVSVHAGRAERLGAADVDGDPGIRVWPAQKQCSLLRGCAE